MPWNTLLKEHSIKDFETGEEKFYKACDLDTASLRIRGLKKFFSGIRHVIPIYVSPFEVMDAKLKNKLNKTKKGNRTKKVLSVSEIKNLLRWLKEDDTVHGIENYAIVFMLLTSGLRADELCQLKWNDLELFEGKWTAAFIGKGGKEAEQELYGPAVEACTKYFRAVFKRDPRPEDALFWTIPSFSGDEPRPLPYHALWGRVNKIGNMAKSEGIINRDISFSPHLFRRSYATSLYKSGMGIKAIQEKTRHASIETLVKHYIHDGELAAPYIEGILA